MKQPQHVCTGPWNNAPTLSWFAAWRDTVDARNIDAFQLFYLYIYIYILYMYIHTAATTLVNAAWSTQAEVVPLALQFLIRDSSVERKKGCPQIYGAGFVYIYIYTLYTLNLFTFFFWKNIYIYIHIVIVLYVSSVYNQTYIYIY